MLVSFVLSFFPRDVLDGILNLIGSVSEGFPSYSLYGNLLNRLGFGDVWVAQGVGNINTFIKILKIRVKDIFMQEWHSRLDNSTRARFYFHISDF